ncbi:hypothetical protein BT93_D1299 [Corymbia citriodora subsp. variegata]|nr:hypothetical protein BT93_D1299 [Corymbia citriodora subsp. variegata]
MHPEVYKAIKSGDHAYLMRIISGNEEDFFHQTTPKKNNILHVAAQYKSCLLWQGNYKGDTPLHVAAKVGSNKMVQVFINEAKSPYQPDACKELLRRQNSHKDTTLHYAVRGGHSEVVELLIKEDPQLCDIINAADESPLYMAAHQRLPYIIELILNAYSSSSSYKGPNGPTGLHAAVHFSLPTVRLLLQHDTSAAYDLDKEGDSALHIAAFRGHIRVIKRLVKDCPDAWDMINNKGQTALHVVKHILRVPNREDLINEEDTDGNTALHLAMVHKRYQIIYILARVKRVDRFATNKDHLIVLDMFFASEKVDFSTARLFRVLEGSQGFPVIRDWVEKYVKRRLDKQFVKGQPAGSMTTGSNIANHENSDSSMRSIVDAQLLVAAFIATVTFAAAFTMPGGYSNDGPNQGMATLAGRAAFQAFVIFNTIAFSFSTLALFLQYDTSYSSDRRKARYIFQAASNIYLAMLGMVLAFASGTYVVLTKTNGLGIIPFILMGVLGLRYWTNGFRATEMRFGALRVHNYRALRKSRLRYGIR